MPDDNKGDAAVLKGGGALYQVYTGKYQGDGLEEQGQRHVLDIERAISPGRAALRTPVEGSWRRPEVEQENFSGDFRGYAVNEVLRRYVQGKSVRLFDLTRESSKVGDDAPTCPKCGTLMMRNGSCFLCHNCGATSGCS